MKGIALLMNAATAALVTYCIVHNIRTEGFRFVRYYTQLSNIFLGVASAICVVAEAKMLLTGSAMPQWVRMTKYMATCCTTVTLIVVLAILSPMWGWKKMLFDGDIFFLHLLCPVLGIVSYKWIETAPPLPGRAALIAVIPTLIYGATMVTLNILRKVDGPYPFLRVYKQSPFMSVVWSIVILGGAYGIAAIL